MQISLPPELQQQIDQRVQSGQYRSAQDVIAAALASLQQQEMCGDVASEELDTLLEEGKQAIERGDVMDGNAAFAELRRRHNLRLGKQE